MFRTNLAVCVGLFLGVVAFAQGPASETAKSDAPKGAEDLLKDGLGEKFGAGSVAGVEKIRGQLRVRTNLPVVNDAAYAKVIVETCRIIGGNAILYEGTKEIAIVNRLQRQGYIFSAPAKCPSLLEAQEDELKSLVFAGTRFCNRNCDPQN